MLSQLCVSIFFLTFAYFGVDDDLNTYRKRKNGTVIAGSGKRHGVKRQNVDVPEMSEMSKLKPSLSGLPHNSDRERTHYASPWLDSEIRLHTKAVQRRLALQLGFTASAYLLHGFLRAFAVSRAPDQKTVNARMDYNDFNSNARLFPDDVYAPIISFEPDFDAEEAWLKTKGYIKQMQQGWGLSSFNMKMCSVDRNRPYTWRARHVFGQYLALLLLFISLVVYGIDLHSL